MCLTAWAPIQSLTRLFGSSAVKHLLSKRNHEVVAAEVFNAISLKDVDQSNDVDEEEENNDVDDHDYDEDNEDEDAKDEDAKDEDDEDEDEEEAHSIHDFDKGHAQEDANGNNDESDNEGQFLHPFIELEAEEESVASYEAEMEEEQANIYVSTPKPRVCLASRDWKQWWPGFL